MKTLLYTAILTLLNYAIALCQTEPGKKKESTPVSKVTVRVLDRETFKLLSANVIIVSQSPENQFDPVFEDKVYKYKISGTDTTTFSVFAKGYETLSESIVASEINGTEFFYLTPKAGDRGQKGNIEKANISVTPRPILPEDITSVLYFHQSSTRMSLRSQRELERVLDFLRRTEIRRIELSGHTDNVGDPVKNVTLSADRVSLVRQLFTNTSLPGRIKVEALGSSRPAAPNDCERNRRFNRRVEIRIEPVY
jgi:OmpA-OmpF porin, OOP family